MKKKKTIIIISIIILVLIIMAVVIAIILMNKNKQKENKININIEELENNFDNIFTNTIYPETEENKAKVTLGYDIETMETGKYKINANIPNINIETEEAISINADIVNVFVKTILQVMEQEGTYTIYNVDYTAYINNNILSIVIKCTLKEGANPQRIVIKTYNYDMENEKILTLKDILENKNLDENEIQDKILEKIKSESEKISAIKESGYNIYKRDINNSIYKIENTTEFFLGDKNILYIVYSYGNNNYTSEIDLIICE